MKISYYKVAYREKKVGTILCDTTTPFHAIKNTWRYWAADPFVFEYNGDTYIFAELYDYLRRRGTIGYCKIARDGKTTRWKSIISEKYHMSYPYICVHDHDIYIIPETMFGGTVDIYKAVKFPDKWEKINSFISDQHLVDTTFIKNNDTFYAVSCDMDGSINQKLRIFEVTDTGNFIESMHGPVVDDISTARPAGKFFTINDRVIRVSQDCKEDYGMKINFLEVQSDFKSFYIEKVIKKIGSGDIKVCDIPNPLRIHTYNANDQYEVIDVFCENKNVINFLGRCIACVIKRVIGKDKVRPIR